MIINLTEEEVKYAIQDYLMEHKDVKVNLDNIEIQENYGTISFIIEM